MIWDTLTSPQFAALPKTVPVVLPLAATEQHGPHLPLATDRLIAEHFTVRLDAELSENVLILPTVSVGCSEHHLRFLRLTDPDARAFRRVCHGRADFGCPSRLY